MLYSYEYSALRSSFSILCFLFFLCCHAGSELPSSSVSCVLFRSAWTECRDHMSWDGAMPCEFLALGGWHAACSLQPTAPATAVRVRNVHTVRAAVSKIFSGWVAFLAASRVPPSCVENKDLVWQMLEHRKGVSAISAASTFVVLSTVRTYVRTPCRHDR